MVGLGDGEFRATSRVRVDEVVLLLDRPVKTERRFGVPTCALEREREWDECSECTLVDEDCGRVASCASACAKPRGGQYADMMNPRSDSARTRPPNWCGSYCQRSIIS